MPNNRQNRNSIKKNTHTHNKTSLPLHKTRLYAVKEIGSKSNLTINLNAKRERQKKSQATQVGNTICSSK